MPEVLPLSKEAQTIKPGRYRHFKGGLYEVLGVGRMSEQREEEMVVYRSLENGYIWLRPVVMFLEHVDRPGHKGPRFTHIA